MGPVRRTWTLGAVGVDRVGRPLVPWEPGGLDVHHVANPGGDATLVVGPGGSTLLVDAGAASRRMWGRMRPGQGIARYAAGVLDEVAGSRLDHVLITHLHADHIGAVWDGAPVAPGRGYRLTGVSDVDAELGIGTLIDPDHPEYGYPPFEGVTHCENYVAYVADRVARGGRVERVRVGGTTQIDLGGAGGEQATVRAVAARGRVWTGHGDSVVDRWPPRDELDPADYPDENSGSIALRLEYGAFSYFCAGDLTDWGDAGTRPWLASLSPAARAAGPVSVAVAPHHGLYDGVSAAVAAALAPRVWVVSTWNGDHPSPSTLALLFHPRLYRGDRDVHVTALSPEAESYLARWVDRLASRAGHVVVRVAPGGDTFRVVVVDETTGLVRSVSAVLAAQRRHPEAQAAS
jgi:glyoxylase-like metal-dependent hydrolase (beta-lactamase superfamily II)